ncbi:hypothetical protein ACVW00_003839 [Marmoricola sp. URHA0025 HA25]
MTKAVFVDKHVLTATADALTRLAADLPGLLSAADGLDVGGEVAQLRAAPTWASETAVDLRARVGLVERLEHGDTHFKAFTVSPEELRQMAGGSMAVDEQLYTLEAAQIAKRKGEHGILDWDGAQNFSDWIEKVEARALAHLPLLNDKGELIEKGIHAFDEYQDLLKTAGMTGVAVTALGKTQAYSLLFKVTSRWGDLGVDALRARGMLQQADWLRRGISAVDSMYLSGKRTLYAPGTALPWLKAQAVKYILKSQTFDDALAAARTATNVRGEASVGARILNTPFIRDNMDRLVTIAKSDGAGRIANITGNVFGRPWTTTVLNEAGVAETVVVGRNATNLLRVAGADGVLTSMKVAGGLRVLGVAGSAFATVDSGIGLYNSISSGELARNWSEGGTQGKAKVIGDIAEVGFNASLTAAMVAPNPVTWGAVAVTGVVYGGARLVEHWDDVTDAVGDAADWTGDKIGDAADAVGDTIGDGVDAIKKSPINPGNWF